MVGSGRFGRALRVPGGRMSRRYRKVVAEAGVGVLGHHRTDGVVEQGTGIRLQRGAAAKMLLA